jgi:hypothetical protein
VRLGWAEAAHLVEADQVRLDVLGQQPTVHEHGGAWQHIEKGEGRGEWRASGV